MSLISVKQRLGLNKPTDKPKTNNHDNIDNKVKQLNNVLKQVNEAKYFINMPLKKGDKGANWVAGETTQVVHPIRPKDKPRAPLKSKISNYPKLNKIYAKTNIYKNDEENKFLPAVITEDIFTPKDLNEKQKKYRANVYSIDDIKKPTKKVFTAKRGRGLARYVFVNDFVACINGMLYYSIPLLLSLIIFFINCFTVSFWQNAIVAGVALISTLLIFGTVKNQEFKWHSKVLSIILILLIDLSLLYLLTQTEELSEFYKSVDWEFTIKLYFLIFSIYYFIEYYVLFWMGYVQDCNMSKKHVKVHSGDPGSGKTSRAVHEGYLRAVQNFNELKYEFWLMHSMRDKIFESGDVIKILKYKKLEESIEFYNSHPDKIPCLHSSFIITDYQGRTSYDITLDHLRGLKALPQRCCIVFDELGAVLKNEFSKSKIDYYDVSDFARLIRHWYNGYFFGCEQDHKNIYIDFRRVVGENVLISSTEWLHKPIILNGIFEFLKFFKYDSLDKNIKEQPKYASFLDKLERFVKSIGFRKQYFKSISNVETGAQIDGKTNDDKRVVYNSNTRTRIMPSGLSARYDDRQYFVLNPSVFDKGFDYEDKHSKNRINLLHDRQYVSTTANIDEKRRASDDLIFRLLGEEWAVKSRKNDENE